MTETIEFCTFEGFPPALTTVLVPAVAVPDEEDAALDEDEDDVDEEETAGHVRLYNGVVEPVVTPKFGKGAPAS